MGRCKEHSGQQASLLYREPSTQDKARGYELWHCRVEGCESAWWEPAIEEQVQPGQPGYYTGPADEPPCSCVEHGGHLQNWDSSCKQHSPDSTPPEPPPARRPPR